MFLFFFFLFFFCFSADRSRVIPLLQFFWIQTSVIVKDIAKMRHQKWYQSLMIIYLPYLGLGKKDQKHFIKR